MRAARPSTPKWSANCSLVPFSSTPLSRLSPRETELLRYIAQGYINTAIAERLHVSLSTVEKHIHSLMDKLELPRDSGYSRRVLAILRYLDD